MRSRTLYGRLNMKGYSTWCCVAKVTIWSVTKAMLKEGTVCATKIATRRKHNLKK